MLLTNDCRGNKSISLTVYPAGDNLISHRLSYEFSSHGVYKSEATFHDDMGPVFVANPQMQAEYAILKMSKIYQLTNQPTGARRLTLHPVRHLGGCGNPIILTCLTFGIIPGTLPARRVFEYDLETDGVTVQYAHFLPLYERFSIWEGLSITSDQKMMAKGLARSTRSHGPYFGVVPLPAPH